MASKNVKTWLRYTFCTTSVHLMNDESYDWLMGATHYMWLGNTLMKFERAKNRASGGSYDKEMIEVTMFTRSRSRFQELLKLAKEAYMMEEKEKIVIKMVDESRDSGDWRQVALKNRRSLSSVITEGSLKEMLERDINQFCKAERCNNKEKLDPALIRPGRADIVVEFKNASHAVYRDLFKVFYPVVGEYPVTCARASDEPALHSGNDEKAKRALTEEDIQELANDFASALPEGDFSTAQVQGDFCFRSLGQTPAEKCNTYLGMLMGHRDYPGEAVDAVAEWVAEKRKEKEEDERKQRDAEDAKAKAKEEAEERRQRRQEEREEKKRVEREKQELRKQANDSVRQASPVKRECTSSARPRLSARMVPKGGFVPGSRGIV
ncbi:hypothetical protein QFC20_007868 [Naganishia adeliensis]|uniref:Uncharacterized protein n=1 Tax=Naganishia adeliensis TaxID=92952 RepID=A0ACC2UWA1_9TREE|nr:hypothetical protein QFC20_007868 [Naganishia adeliensis]